MPETVSLRVIAEHIGLSKPTVQRVLGGEAHLFREETVQRVLAAARELGYRKPGAAQRSPCLDEAVAVVCVPALAGDIRRRVLGSPHFITYGALHALQEAGLNGLMVRPDGLADELPDHVVQMRPKGVVLPCFAGFGGVSPTRRIERIKDAGIPLVVFGDYPEFSDFDRVTPDHEGGSYELMRWVIAQGRRRIAHFWPAPASQYWFAARRRGYERALREAGLEPLPDILYETADVGPSDQREGFVRQARLLGGYLLEHLRGPQPVDALLVAHDGDAPKLAHALRLAGLTPNVDVMVLGYDYAITGTAEPQFEPTLPAATVDKGNWEMGVEMVRLLLERIEGTLAPEPQVRVVRSKLVLGPEIELALRAGHA